MQRKERNCKRRKKVKNKIKRWQKVIRKQKQKQVKN